MKILSIFLLCISVSACGLKPFYATSAFPNSDQLSYVAPVPIDTLYGAEYYERISQLLRSAPPAKYTLKTSIHYTNSFSVILQNSDVVRDRIKINTSYTLSDISSGKILTNGSFTRSLSYSTTFSPYSNTVLQNDTSVKLARASAEEIHNRLVMYFANQH